MQFSAFLQQEGGRFVIHYLGDILLTEIPGSEGCADSFEDIQASWLAISVNKLEGLCGCACHSL